MFSTPKNLLVEDFWSSRNERKPISKQNMCFRKWWRVSQKQWMLELSNLCHCVQHPKNLLVEVSGALGTKEAFLLSVLKTCVSQRKSFHLPAAKVGSSAKFCVVVCKSSLLWYWEGPLAKVSSSAKFCVVVCKSSLLWYQGGSLAKEGLSAKFGLAVFKVSLLNCPPLCSVPWKLTSRGFLEL